MSKANTPAERVRETLSRIEGLLPKVRGSGSQALELLRLIDQVRGELQEMAAAGVDVRAERARLETALSTLRRSRRRFLAEIGSEELRRERETVQPDEDEWWWYLDRLVSEDQSRLLRQVLVGALILGAILAAAWFVYDRFLAPPREVRQAYRHELEGASLAEEGDLEAALAQFEAASALMPDDPDLWLWQGVIHDELDEPDEAEGDFETARSLSDTAFEFFLGRGAIYLRVGDLEAAEEDADRAISAQPDAGWAYFLRGNVALEQEDYAAAVADYQMAEALAKEAGDLELEAYARAQLATALQMQGVMQITPTP